MDKKRKLLVISYYYAPVRNIASVRWSKLAKYFTEYGWDVDVITTSSIDSVDRLLIRDMDRMGSITFIDHADKRFAPSEQQKETLASVLSGSYVPPETAASGTVPIRERKGLAALKHRIGLSRPVAYYAKKKNVRNDLLRSQDFARQAEKHIRENGGLDKYDAVISTYGPVGDVILALRLKKLYPDTPLIMDFRDQMDGIHLPRRDYRRMRRLQKKACLAADAVCVISNGKVKWLSDCCGKNSNVNITVITNGYDRDDVRDITPTVSDKLTFCFTGRIYTDMYDFSPLWKCLKELSDSGKIDLSRVSFAYAGADGEYLGNDIAKYGIGSIFDNRGVISRDDALKLQFSSDGLVMCIWNTKMEQGVLNGKSLEYMMAGKPIIAMVTGELGGSDIRQILEGGSMGIAYEQADAEESAARLKEYVLAMYNEKINGIPSGFKPDENAVKRFDYREISKRYIELIESVCR